MAIEQGRSAPRLGVKGYAPEIIADGGFCEVSLLDVSDLGERDLIGARGQVVLLCALRELKHDCWEELRERMDQLAPLAVVWCLPPQYPLWGHLHDLIETIRELRLKPELHYVDAPFPLAAIGAASASAVWDPLAPPSMDLDQEPGRARYWRIHGWHPDRWVRRYSPAQLGGLAASIARFAPRFVTLAHSQRLAQWGELRRALQQLEGEGALGR